MIVALSHPLSGSGLPASWTAASCARRVGLIRDGAASLWPSFDFRLPGMGSERWRRIGGDPRATMIGRPFGPRPFDERANLRRADLLWRVGPRCAESDTDEQAAEVAGVAVTVLSDDEQGQLVSTGEAVRARAEADAMESAVLAVMSGATEARDFKGAGSVASAAFEGAAGLLGVEGLDYERKATRGGGGGYTFIDRADIAGLRMARAHRILREAKLSDDEVLAVRLRNASGATWSRVALALGWEEDGAARKRAERLVSRAMGKVTAALRRVEAGA